MADIAVTDVTFTVLRRTKPWGTRQEAEIEATVAFGNNTLTYPTGGVPLSTSTDPTNKDSGGTQVSRGCAALGCPAVLQELHVMDQGANAKGFKFEWDKANNKLLVLTETTVATNAALAQHTNATFVPNPATLVLKCKGH